MADARERASARSLRRVTQIRRRVATLTQRRQNVPDLLGALGDQEYSSARLITWRTKASVCASLIPSFSSCPARMFTSARPCPIKLVMPSMTCVTPPSPTDCAASMSCCARGILAIMTCILPVVSLSRRKLSTRPRAALATVGSSFVSETTLLVSSSIGHPPREPLWLR